MERPPARHAAAPVPATAAATRALGVLLRRAGLQGLELPADVGRSLARAELLLTSGPLQLHATRVPAALAAELAGLAAAAAEVTIGVVADEAEVLGQALGADLVGLRFDELYEVADAVLAVSRAPRAAEQWADPRDAAEAERVLDAAGDDLRAAAATHEWLTEHFTDQVWDIPEALLVRAGSRWRLAARSRARMALRRTSRSGRAARTEDRDGVLAARQARQQVEALRHRLSRYLGSLDRGPLSDADRALAAVRAVRRLQSALGLRLDIERLERLVLADAFRSEEVFAPAVNIRLALIAWQRDVDSYGGQDAWTQSPAGLADWTAEVVAVLPDMRAALAACTALEVPAATLRDLVDLHVLRQHIAEVTAGAPAVAPPAAPGRVVPARDALPARDEGVVS